jgi:hypothetical protein
VPRPTRPCLVVPVALLLLTMVTAPAWAWGRLGHRVISRLAEKELTPTAKATIAELLAPGESLADASTWPDEIKGRMRHTAPWHYVDVPLDEPKYDAKFSESREQESESKDREQGHAKRGTHCARKVITRGQRDRGQVQTDDTTI